MIPFSTDDRHDHPTSSQFFLEWPSFLPDSMYDLRITRDYIVRQTKPLYLIKNYKALTFYTSWEIIPVIKKYIFGSSPFVFQPMPLGKLSWDQSYEKRRHIEMCPRLMHYARHYYTKARCIKPGNPQRYTPGYGFSSFRK